MSLSRPYLCNARCSEDLSKREERRVLRRLPHNRNRRCAARGARQQLKLRELVRPGRSHSGRHNWFDEYRLKKKTSKRTSLPAQRFPMLQRSLRK